MKIILAIWSSWLHSQLWEPLWQGLFSSVRYYGHSGSQEIGHLKLVVFAGEWLFEEFLRANGAYRGFFLKKPFTINTVENSDGGTQGENVRWGAHRGKIHCKGGIWLFEEHTVVNGHNILQRKKALAIEALRVENVIMRTKLLKWSSFSPNFTQKVSFSPLPRTLLPHGIVT